MERSWITPAACLPLIHVHEYSGLTELIEINMGHISYNLASLFIRQSNLCQLNQKLASMYCSIAVSVLELTMSWQLSVSSVVQGIPFPTVAAREARELQYHMGGISNSRGKLNIKWDVRTGTRISQIWNKSEEKTIIWKVKKQRWRTTMIWKVKKQNWRKNYYMESQETELWKNYDMEGQETILGRGGIQNLRGKLYQRGGQNCNWNITDMEQK